MTDPVLDDPEFYVGVTDERERAQRRELLGYCVAHGAGHEQLRAAVKQLVPLLVENLEHELRLHLREQVARDMLAWQDLESRGLSGQREVCIGFADLTGFTKLGERSPVDLVGAVGNRMAALAAEAA